MLAVPALAADKLPNVVVLATGGTIAGAAASDVQAGYTSGQVGVEQLLAAVPQAKKLATLRGEQIANIGSQDMNDEVWLKLARRVNELVAMPDVDGVVITHGTDTIEETAYFLNLVVKSKKPVVLTAAMRPSTALSADGPLNFYNAVAVAANKDAAGRGVLVVVNDWIHGASSLTKTSTTAVQTFLSPLRGLIGTVAYGEAEFYRGPVGQNTVDSEFSLDGVTALPRVDIVMAYENMDGAIIDAAVAAGAKGIVIAGVGNGNMTEAGLEGARRPGEEGHRLRALDAGDHRPRRPQRRGRRRQAGSDRLGRSQPPEVPGAAAARAAEAAEPGRDPATFRGILKTVSRSLGTISKELNMRRLAMAAALVFVGAAAFAQDVKTDFDKTANFAAIKTFAVKIGTSWNNPISEKRISDEIQQTLTEKGWTATDADKADAIVAAPRRDREAEEPEHLLLRRLRRLRLPRLGRHGRHGHCHHDDLRVPGRHPGRGHLRRQDQVAHVPGHGLGRDLGQAEKNIKKVQKVADKMFKDFPPGSKDKK